MVDPIEIHDLQDNPPPWWEKLTAWMLVLIFATTPLWLSCSAMNKIATTEYPPNEVWYTDTATDTLEDTVELR